MKIDNSRRTGRKNHKKNRKMPVRIRLRRMGRKKQPHYRIVVADSASPRDGRFVETLGYYKPLTEPARVVVDLDRVDHWVASGALLSGTVASLVRRARHGGDATIAVGEPDPEEVKALKAAALAERRRAETAAREGAAKAEISAAAAAEAATEADAAEAEAEAAEEVVDESDDIPVVATEAADDLDAEESASEEEE